MNWYIGCFKKYAEFDGRSRRTEYWMFILFNMIVSFVFGFIDGMAATGGVIGLLYVLVVFVPSIAVSIRRLHDAGHSGWWLLINLIPILGWIVFLIFTVQDSVPSTNQYGENPKSNSF